VGVTHTFVKEEFDIYVLSSMITVIPGKKYLLIINMNHGSFYSKDKDSQRYLLSLYANEINGCKFAYLDSPDLAATRYFIDRCPNVHLFPINMQANSKEVTEFAKSTKELSREKRVTPLKGDIVSVLYTGYQRFNIIWLDWCDTYKTVASFNDFIKTAHAFEPENCVLAVTLSTHGIRDTIEGSVAIPGQKVLRRLHFLLNGSTGMGFRIKTSSVYPGLDRIDDVETATRMVFLIATLSHKKDLKLPNSHRALDYGAHIGKELLIPIQEVWPGHNANDPSFRKFLTIHDHIIARVYNATPASYPFRYYVQYKPLCADWVNDPDTTPKWFDSAEITTFSSLFDTLIAGSLEKDHLSLLCQAHVEGGDAIKAKVLKCMTKHSKRRESYESDSDTSSETNVKKHKRTVKALLQFARPRGRAPNNEQGIPKEWDSISGEWIE